MQTLIHARLSQKLAKRELQAHRRTLSPPSTAPIDFASNDYLGFSRNPHLRQKVHAASTSLPLGATGSRLLSGNSSLAEALEQQIAKVFQRPAALLFNSGYNVNVGLLQAVTEPGDHILLDEGVHASFKDGLKLSAAQAFYFRHNDLEHLEHRLRRLSSKLQAGGQCFVAIESVYSMDGDLAPLAAIVALCRQYQALLIIDEAHGLGTLGPQGKGLVAHEGLEDAVFAHILTFGKALGCHGAALLGHPLLMACMLNFCHSFIYTTALPAHSLVAIRCALEELLSNPLPYQRLQANIAIFNRSFGFDAHPSPIYSLAFPDIPALKGKALELQKQGIAVYPIFSPTVRRGTERLRIVVHAHNHENEIRQLKEALYPYV